MPTQKNTKGIKALLGIAITLLVILIIPTQPESYQDAVISKVNLSSGVKRVAPQPAPTPAPQPQPTPPPPKLKTDLAVDSNDVVPGNGNFVGQTFVSYKASNTGDRDLSKVDVRMIVYPKNGINGQVPTPLVYDDIVPLWKANTDHSYSYYFDLDYEKVNMININIDPDGDFKLIESDRTNNVMGKYPPKIETPPPAPTPAPPPSPMKSSITKMLKKYNWSI